MKKSKILSLIFAVTLVISAFAGCGSSGEYIIPAYDEELFIEIGAWDVNSLSTPGDFNECAEAGFTLLLPIHTDFGKNPTFAQKFLERAEGAGLKVIVRDISLVNDEGNGANLGLPADTKNIGYYKDSPAFAGILICDETGASKYPYVKEKYDLAKELFPGKTAWTNLKPMNVAPEHLEAGSYREYVEGFMDTVAPDTLSYTNYCLFSNGTIRSVYYSNLEYVKQVAVNYGVKSHNFILAIEHWGQGGHYAPPTEKTLRWQIACNLAYGYDFFTYYTYSTAVEEPNWTYNEGMIDRQGKKTEIYGYAKTVNTELRAWDHVYMSFVDGWKGLAVIPGSHGQTDHLLHYLDYSKSPSEIAGVKSIESTEYALAGMFEDANGNKGYMLTNASNPFQNKDAAVKIAFDKQYKGVQVFEKGVPAIYDLDKNGGITINLESGEGKFIIPLKKG